MRAGSHDPHKNISAPKMIGGSREKQARTNGPGGYYVHPGGCRAGPGELRTAKRAGTPFKLGQYLTALETSVRPSRAHSPPRPPPVAAAPRGGAGGVLGDLAKEVLGWVEKGMAEDDDARPFLMAGCHVAPLQFSFQSSLRLTAHTAHLGTSSLDSWN